MNQDERWIHETKILEQIRSRPGTAPPLITHRKDEEEEEEVQESKQGGHRPGWVTGYKKELRTRTILVRPLIRAGGPGRLVGKVITDLPSMVWGAARSSFAGRELNPSRANDARAMGWGGTVLESV